MCGEARKCIQAIGFSYVRIGALLYQEMYNLENKATTLEKNNPGIKA